MKKESDYRYTDKNLHSRLYITLRDWNWELNGIWITKTIEWTRDDDPLNAPRNQWPVLIEDLRMLFPFYQQLSFRLDVSQARETYLLAN